VLTRLNTAAVLTRLNTPDDSSTSDKNLVNFDPVGPNPRILQARLRRVGATLWALPRIFSYYSTCVYGRCCVKLMKR